MAQLLWAWTFHAPVPVCNLVLRTFIPEETMGSDKANITRVKDTYKLKDYAVDLFGGISEGVNFPCTIQSKTKQRFHDEDCNVLLINQHHIVGPGESSFARLEEMDGGFARIRVNNPSSVHPRLTTTEGDVTYLRSDVFYHSIPDMKSGEIIPYPEIDMQDAWHRNVPTPAWNHTCALRCKQWPKAASEWDTRKRLHDFPTKVFMEEMQSDGCFLVPQAPRTGGCVGEVCTTWTFSFVNAERKLMNSLTSLQKHIFIIFKIICFQKLSSPLIIEAHHLHALFLRACEQVPKAMWRPEQLTQLLIFNLDRLLHALIDNIIPGYINADTNLLEGQSTDFLDDMQILVCELKSKCMDVVLEFCRNFPFEGTPKWLDRHVLQPVQDVVDNVTLPLNISDCVVHVIAPFLIRFACAYVEPNAEVSADQCVGVLKAYHRLFNQFAKVAGLQLREQVIWHLALQDFSDDLHWQIRVHEYVIEHTDYPDKISFRSNLACHYHTLFSQGKHEYKIKAKEMFQSCGLGMKGANKMDYAVFLCKTDECETAMDILCEIIQDKGCTDANGYDKQELATLETSIQDLGHALGELNGIPARSHAFYLLLTCYTRLNKMDMFNETLCQFIECYKSGDTISRTLLALALEKAGRYKEAFNMYRTACYNAKDNEKYIAWADRKQEMCLNMVSLQWEEEGKDVEEERSRLQLQNGVEVSEASVFNSTEEVTNGVSPECTTVCDVHQNTKRKSESDEDALMQEAIAMSLQGLKLQDEVAPQNSDGEGGMKIRQTDTATTATDQVTQDGPTTITVKSTENEEADDMDEEAQLQKAIAMSMQMSSSSETSLVIGDGAITDPNTPEDSSSKSGKQGGKDDVGDDPQFQIGLAMSMEDQ